MSVLEKIQETVFEISKDYNPVVKTSLKPIEAKQIACVSYEFFTKGTAIAAELGSAMRLFMDEDLKLMFDEDLNSASVKNQKMARLFFTLAEMVLNFKEFCNTVVDMSVFLNNLILRHKENNPLVQAVDESKSLEGLIANWGIDQNQFLDEIKKYKNPIELFANFALEFHNMLDKETLADYQATFLLRMQEALKEFMPLYQINEVQKNTDFYNKICKIMKI